MSPCHLSVPLCFFIYYIYDLYPKMGCGVLEPKSMQDVGCFHGLLGIHSEEFSNCGSSQVPGSEPPCAPSVSDLNLSTLICGVQRLFCIQEKGLLVLVKLC
jgi:hypothetical protein